MILRFGIKSNANHRFMLVDSSWYRDVGEVHRRLVGFDFDDRQQKETGRKREFVGVDESLLKNNIYIGRF